MPPRLRLPSLPLWPLALLVSAWFQPAVAQLAAAPRSLQQPLLSGETAAVAADPIVRVLVFEGAQVSVAAAGQPLRLSDPSGRVLGLLQPGQSLRLQRDPAQVSGLLLELEPSAIPQASGQPPSTEIWLDPVVPEALSVIQQRQYRGRLQVRSQGEGLQVINHLPLEAYLPSVVGSEMPAGWPQPALRAQAVAARTYALRQRKPEQPFDLRATVSSQVYRGVESETASTREAVAATRAQVLTYRGDLIEAVFHSSAGGSTEASGDLWAQQLPYLVPVPDFDDHSPVRRWQERFEPEQLRTIFQETDGVLALTVLERSSSGRVREVRIDGPRGSLRLSGAQLRQRLGLRSTLVEITLLRASVGVATATSPVSSGAETASPSQNEGVAAGPIAALLPLPPLPGAEPLRPLAGLLISGRGFGHGIGMSQWGAYGLALRGADHATILSHYYPGTQLDAYRGR